MKNKVAVVVPYYSSQLNKLEEISLKQCKKVLHNYPIILVVPDTMKEAEYPKEYEFKFVKVPEEWLYSISSYNRMMLNIDFYNKFLDYEYILIYQLDAFVFRDELQMFCDFGYDYIGAPWPYGIRYIKNVKDCIWYVGNGGLSLRKIDSSILMIKKNHAEFWDGQEDIFWATCDSVNFHVAPKEIARHFSIETQVRNMITLNRGKIPFGCHAWEKWDFLFWKPFLEKEGYQFSEEIIGNKDNEKEVEVDILTIPSKRVYEKFVELTHQKNEQLYVWGTGAIGKEAVLLFRHAGLIVQCVDSSEKRWEKYLWDVCIKSPDILRGTNKDSIIIVATEKYKNEIIDALVQMGFLYGKNIFSYTDIRDNIKKYCIYSKNKYLFEE